MKIQKISQWFSLLLFVTMATSCSPLSKGAATPSLTTPTISIGSLSSTKIPSTFTPTATDTPTPLPILTIAPTIPIEDARNRLLDLLKTNGDCKLPCLWGITSGKSNNQEARNILIPLSSISPAETIYFEPAPLRGILGGTITPHYVEGDLHLNASISYLYSDDGIVTSIGFRVLEERVTLDSNGDWTSKRPIYDSPTFIKRVEYYSLSHLLSEQGIPTSVMIASSGPSENRRNSISTYIAVFYPERGIWAQYTTVINGDEVGNTVISCPVNAHIEMTLSAPGNPDAFLSFLEQTNWGITKNSYKPLEEATSMSINEFYETFKNPTDKCIETPTNIWPTPEIEGVN
mgnify:CR=1 FL=1